MAAPKDDGQEPPADSRRAVIWRLPATAGTTESADAPDAPDAEADRPKDRRVPLPVVWGLVAALVCVGLYAAWSEFGSDILGTSGEPDAAAASASATPSAAEQPGAGAGATGGGGEASASPPVAGESAPVVTAADDTGKDAEADVETGLVEETAPVVAAPQGGETAPQEGPEPESPLPAADPPRQLQRLPPTSRRRPRQRSPLATRRLRRLLTPSQRLSTLSLAPNRLPRPESETTRLAHSTPGLTSWRQGPVALSTLAPR